MNAQSQTISRVTTSQLVSNLELAEQVINLTVQLEKTQSDLAISQRMRHGLQSRTNALAVSESSLKKRLETSQQGVAAATADLKALTSSHSALQTKSRDQLQELSELRSVNPARLQKQLKAAKQKLADKTQAIERFRGQISQLKCEKEQLGAQLAMANGALDKIADNANKGLTPDILCALDNGWQIACNKDFPETAVYLLHTETDSALLYTREMGLIKPPADIPHVVLKRAASIVKRSDHP